jgi:antitoxin (DNA-binding transcriptional repressor) of toxin-antitoxin stability system
MVVTASQLRQDIYRLLDRVLETGEPLEIERKGRRLRILADERPSRLAALVPHPGTVVGDPDDLIDLDWTDAWRGDLPA